MNKPTSFYRLRISLKGESWCPPLAIEYRTLREARYARAEYDLSVFTIRIFKITTREIKP